MRIALLPMRGRALHTTETGRIASLLTSYSLRPTYASQATSTYKYVNTPKHARRPKQPECMRSRCKIDMSDAASVLPTVRSFLHSAAAAAKKEFHQVLNRLYFSMALPCPALPYPSGLVQAQATIHNS